MKTTDLRNYTISKATLRNEDLITSCIHFLWEINKETARGIWKENPNLLKALCDRECGIPSDWWETDEANFLLNETIYDAMDALPLMATILVVIPAMALCLAIGRKALNPKRGWGSGFPHLLQPLNA